MHVSLRLIAIAALTVLLPLVADAQTTARQTFNPPQERDYTIRDTFPPLHTPNPATVSPRWTIYGHPSPPYPRYVGAWGTGWKAWKPSGGADGLGYWYQYHTHVPGVGVKYYRGPVATYYPGPYGVSPATGFSHYGYGPLGW